MVDAYQADLCVIGGGAGGLSVAAVAAQMGVTVVLIENDVMGGDCLNLGCIPSKALIAAARVMKTISEADKFGIKVKNVSVDYKKVQEHIQNVIASMAPHDSIERFQSLKVKVIIGVGSFVDHKTVKVNDKLIFAKRFIISTGSSPVVPDIPGLKDVPFLTNEDIFKLEKKPEHLMVIGGGPIGCEMAQAHSLLGIKVSLFQRQTIMGKDDPDMVDIIRDQFLKEGINLYENMQINGIKMLKKNIQISIEQYGNQHNIAGSHLLIATGRKPNIEDLNLDAAKIKYGRRGIQVNKHMRTSNRRVYAIGDVAEGFQFTHIANYQAGIAIKNALFHWPAKVNYDALPWATYTEPSLAHVGMQEADAFNKYKNIRVLSVPFSENDRAQTEEDIIGYIKVLTKTNGQIIGVTIVGRDADELIGMWTLAIRKKMKIGSIVDCIIPYPTRTEINRQAASLFYTTKLYSPRMKKFVRFLMRFL